MADEHKRAAEDAAGHLASRIGWQNTQGVGGVLRRKLELDELCASAKTANSTVLGAMHKDAPCVYQLHCCARTACNVVVLPPLVAPRGCT